MSVFKKIVWFLGVALPASILTFFAIANRHDVALVLDPLTDKDTSLTVELPLFLLVFAALALGLILGGLTTWLGQGKWRKRARERAGEVVRLRQDVDRLSAQAEQSEQARLPVPAETE